MVMHPGKTPYGVLIGDLVQVDRPWDLAPAVIPPSPEDNLTANLRAVLENAPRLFAECAESRAPDAADPEIVFVSSNIKALSLNVATETIKPDGVAQLEEQLEPQVMSPLAQNAAKAIVSDTLGGAPGALVLHVEQLLFELLTGRVGQHPEMRKMAFSHNCYYDKLFKNQRWEQIQFSVGFHSPEGTTAVIMKWFVTAKVTSVELLLPPANGLNDSSFSNGYTPPIVGPDGAWIVTLGEILETNWTPKDKPVEPHILIEPTDVAGFEAALKFGASLQFLDGQANEMRERLCNQLQDSGPEYSQIVAAIVVQDDKTKTLGVCRESAEDVGLLGEFNHQVLKDYIVNMRKPTTWGDHLEISVFTSAHDFRVCVTQYSEGQFRHMGQFGNGNGAVLNLLYLNGNHYAALLPCHASPNPATPAYLAQLAVNRTALDLAPFAPIKLRSTPQSGVLHWMLYNGPGDGKCLFRMLAFLKLAHELSIPHTTKAVREKNSIFIR
jgi:hypothetical protein